MRGSRARTLACVIAAIATACAFALTLAATATAAPANDNIANAIALPTSVHETGGANDTTVGATTQANEISKVNGTMCGSKVGDTIWYKWTAPSTGYYPVDLFGSGWDTVLSIGTDSNVSSPFSGSNWNGNVYPAGQDDDESFLGFFDAIDTTNGDVPYPAGNPDYLEGNSGSLLFWATTGTTYYIQVAACDPVDAWYGAGPAPITIDVNHAAVNDTFVDAPILWGGDNGGSKSDAFGVVTASTVGATTGESSEPGTVAGQTPTGSIWFEFMPPDSGTTYTFDTMGSLTNFNTLLAAYKGATTSGNTLATITSVASNDDVGAPYTGSTASSITFTVPSGNTKPYFIEVAGKGGASGLVELRWSETSSHPANDNIASAQSLTGSGPWTQSADVAPSMGTIEAGEPTDHNPVTAGVANGTAELDDSSTWYTWTAPASGTYDLNTFGSDYDVDVNVYALTGALSFADLAAVSSTPYSISDKMCGSLDDNGTLTQTGGAGQHLLFSAVSGKQYYFRMETRIDLESPDSVNWGDDADDTAGGGDMDVQVTSFPAAPSNDNFANATSEGSANQWNSGCQNNVGATMQSGEPSPASLASGQTSVWYKWTPTFTGTATFKWREWDLFDGDGAFGIYTGSSVTALTPVTTTSHYYAGGDGPDKTYYWFNVTAGTTYYFLVASTEANDNGYFAFGVDESPYAFGIQIQSDTGDNVYEPSWTWDNFDGSYFQSSATEIKAKWTPTPDQPVTTYGYCVFSDVNDPSSGDPCTTPGDALITSGTVPSASMTLTGLSLTDGQAYGVCVWINTAYFSGEATAAAAGAMDCTWTVVDLDPPDVVPDVYVDNDIYGTPGSPLFTSFTTGPKPVLDGDNGTDELSGAAGVNIYRGTNATGPWTKIASDYASGTYTDGALAPGVYYYEVTQLDNVGWESAPSPVIQVTVGASQAMYVADTSAGAQSGSTNGNAEASNTFFSWENDSNQTVQPYDVQVSALPYPGDPSTVGIWNLDGSTTDASPTANAMTLGANPPTYVSPSVNAAFAQALSFNGTNNTATIASNTAYNLSGSGILVSAWIKSTTPPASGTYANIVSRGSDCAGSSGKNCEFAVYFNGTAGTVVAASSKGTTTQKTATAPSASIFDGHWHLVGVDLTTNGSGASVVLFVDGVQKASTSLGGAPPSGSGQTVNVGSRGSADYYHGLLDSLSAYADTQDASDVAAGFEARYPLQYLVGDTGTLNLSSTCAGSSAGTTRCKSIQYPTTQPVLSGGVYAARSKFTTTASASPANYPLAWSPWDYFGELTGRPINLYTDDSNASTGVANKTTIAGQTPHFSWINTAGQASDTQRVQVVNDPLTNVVGLWHVDNAATDSSGNGNTLTLSGGAHPMTYGGSVPNFGQALLATTTKAYASASNASGQFDLGQFTVSAWFKTSTLPSADDDIVNKSNTTGCVGGGKCNFELELDSAGEVCAQSSSGTAQKSQCTSGPNYANGAWHYAAVTVDASHVLSLYMDGMLVGTKTLAGAVDTDSGAADKVWIGDDSSLDNSYEGIIDDVEITSTAESAAQIAGYYATDLPHDTLMWDSSPSGTGVAMTSCADLTRCADIVYGTGGGQKTLNTHGAMYYVSAEFKLSSKSYWTTWSDWDWFETTPTPAPTTLYTNDSNAQAANCPGVSCVEPTATTSATPHFSLVNGATSAMDHERAQVLSDPLDSTVAALYHFDTATGNTTDSSADGLTLTPSSTPPTYTSGQSAAFGQAASFDNSSASTVEELASPSSTELTVPSQFTVDAWFKTTDPAASGDQWPTLVYDEADDAYMILYFDTGVSCGSSLCLEFHSVDTNGTEDTGGIDATPYEDGNWHYVAATWNGSTMSLYVDGSLQSSNTWPSLVIDGISTLEIGSAHEASANYGFTGSIDDVRVLNVAESAAQIAGYYATLEPHGTVLWDSDATDTGVAMASCAASARCADIDSGSLPTHPGARYYTTAKYRSGATGPWSDWSTPDWFQYNASTTTISLDASSVALPIVLPSQDSTGTSVATIVTNNPDGYSLTGAWDASTTAMTGGANTIPNFGTTCTSSATTGTASWAANAPGGFGVSVLSVTGGTTTRLAKWGALSDPIGSSYCGLSQTAATLHTYAASTASDTVTIAYRNDVTSGQAPGTYTGTVTYTATNNP